VVYVLVGGGVLAAVFDIGTALRDKALRRLPWILLGYIALPCAMAALAWWAAPRKLDLIWQVLIVLGLVVPLGPIVYRVATSRSPRRRYGAVHRLDGGALRADRLGLVFFGGEGLALGGVLRRELQRGRAADQHAEPARDRRERAGDGGAVALLGRSIYGKALRATAVNRVARGWSASVPGSPAG